jgi:hypothetical protein
MSIATDLRAYADLALEQGKAVLNQAGAAVTTANKRLAADAPKPVFVALGVADLVAETVTKRAETVTRRVETVGKRVETLPADAADNVVKVQETGKALISKTQDDALARLSDAKQVYGKLTARGEARLTELRNDPRVTRLLGDLDEVSTAVQARLAPVLSSVRSEVVPYLDSAFDAVKDADLGESAAAANAGHASRTGAARRNGTRRSSATNSSTAGGTARKSAPAKRTAAAAKNSGQRAAGNAAAKATGRKAPATKQGTTRARKAPAKKA